ncbi:MAG TPA: RluA family pseudouridine synthase [Phycisphaerales bacterium]|nr:RluA family pseudouridine synthase [Phycisphaerales bacterium]
MPQQPERADTEQRDDLAVTSGVILPGGKVDARAIVDAAQRARELGLAEEDDEELRRVRFELRRDLNKRLDKYLTDRIAFLSRTQLQKLIDEGGVLVNERIPKSSTKLRAGDVVEVVVPPPPSKDIIPEDIPLEVMYEDEHIIVINKPPDIIVHPARSENTGTMLSALAHHFKRRGGALSAVGKEFARPGVVHRLDRNTSGCIVFAKTDEAHWKLGHQFEHRRVDKRYLAVVHGLVEPDVQVIDLPLGPHPSREKGYREKYVVRHDELGKPSVTIPRVRERYRAGKRGDFTLVELELKTGRTHQIRVHMSHLGWPIVADDMYGGKPVPRDDGSPIIARQALHAAILGFEHPMTGAPLQFTAPLRGDMAELVRSVRAWSNGGEKVAAPGATVAFE